jgi:SAM-dependent methyltransferase
MDAEAVRERIGACWSTGRYETLAEHLVPAAEDVAAAAGEGGGRAAIDVAAGNGNAAVALATRGWRVTATDIAPRMVELGSARTAGMDIEWRQADMTELPAGDGSFDLAVSTFGLIFAADPAAAVAEARRVLTPGGRLILTAWTADGYVAQMTEAMSPWLPSNGGPDPLAWGRPDQVHAWLAASFGTVEIATHTLPWRFGSAREARELLGRDSPGHIAAQQYAGDQAEAMMDAVEQHFADLAEPDGRIDLAAEYLLVAAS